MNLHLETRAIHAAAPELNGSRPVSVPIYQTSTFAFADPEACAEALNDPDAGFAYSRYRNPTTSALEDAAAVEARIREATQYIALTRLALSPQCGFASGEAGNPLTPEEQEAKLRRVAEVARRVWPA